MDAPQNRRPRSLIEVLAHSRSQLIRQATRMLHSGNNAEDVAQDALVSALAHLKNFRGDSKIATWLYRVGTNAVLMRLRHDRRLAERTQRAAQQLPEEWDWVHGTGHLLLPQTQAEWEEQAHLLHAAVEHLPKHYREVVELCDLHEKSVEEAAQALGITVGGVRTRRLRAHRMLRNTLLHQDPNLRKAK